MIRHPLLSALGLDHGFGERGDPELPGVSRPRQVHGARVVPAEACRDEAWPEADAVLGGAGDGRVAVITADCVPVLLASESGSAVAALHAGWRGLAAGVVESGVAALRALAPGQGLCAVVGPHIGPCCYEVDTPVIEALGARYGERLQAALCERRGEHADLDLGVLTRAALEGLGLPSAAIGRVVPGCTCCDARRFHSYRREGVRAGRLLHHIAAAPSGAQG